MNKEDIEYIVKKAKSKLVYIELDSGTRVLGRVEGFTSDNLSIRFKSRIRTSIILISFIKVIGDTPEPDDLDVSDKLGVGGNQRKWND